jgi:ABC-type xylose transport system substrate-binding protein
MYTTAMALSFSPTCFPLFFDFEMLVILLWAKNRRTEVIGDTRGRDWNNMSGQPVVESNIANLVFHINALIQNLDGLSVRHARVIRTTNSRSQNK